MKLKDLRKQANYSEEYLGISNLLRENWQSQLADDEKKLYFQLRHYIPAKVAKIENADSNKRFDGMSSIQDFLKGDEISLVLLGDSGAGKSLFCQFLVDYLWSRQDTCIPIYISLPIYMRPNINFALYLKEVCGLTADQIKLLKDKRALIFLVLDGYDEMQEPYRKINLYQMLGLHEWNVKLIVSCRTEALVNCSAADQLNMFTPTLKGTPQKAVEKKYVQFFDAKQIPDYIERWKSLNYETVDQTIDYFEEIKKLPGISEVITNPFILWVALEVLPYLLESYAALPKLDRYTKTRMALYDRFTQGWFQRQKDKLIKNKKISEEWADTIVDDFHNYCQSLANYMWQMNVTSLCYKTYQNPAENELFQDKNLDRFFAQHTNFDDRPGRPLEIIRQGGLLRVIGGNIYTFLHPSLKEYFFARHLFEGVTSKATIILGSSINSQYLNNDLPTIRTALDFMLKEPMLEQILRDIVEESKHDEHVEIAAANAMTILVAARKSFAGKNLRKIRIRNANIAGGNFEGADLCYSDLRGIDISTGWFRHAHLSGSLVDNIQIGELSVDKLESRVIACAFSHCGQYYAVLAEWELYIFETSTHKIIQKKSLKETGYYPWEKVNVSWKKYTAFAVSSSSEAFLLGTSEGMMILYKFPSVKSSFVCKAHNEGVTALALSQNGQTAVSAGKDRTLKVWDFSDRTHDNSWLFEVDIISLVFGKEGSTVYIGHDMGIIHWDINKGEHICIIEFKHWPISSLSFNIENGWFLAGNAKSGLIGQFNPLVSKTLAIWDEHAAPVTALALSNDKNFALSGSTDNSIKRWNCLTNECVSTWYGHSSAVTAVAFSPDGTWALSGSKDMTIGRWRLDVAGGPILEGNQKLNIGMKNISSGVKAIGVCSEGRTLCILNEHSQKIDVLDCISGDIIEHELPSIPLNPNYLLRWQSAGLHREDLKRDLRVSTDGRYSYTRSGKLTIEKRNLVTDERTSLRIDQIEMEKKLSLDRDASFFKMMFSDDHRFNIEFGRILVLSQDGTFVLTVADYERNKGGGRVPLRRESYEAFFVFKLETQECVAVWDHRTGCLQEKPTNTCALSPDGKWAIMGRKDSSIRIESTIENHKLIPEQIRLTAVITIINWSSNDPSLIVMAMEDGSVSAWRFEIKPSVRFGDVPELHLRWQSKPWGLQVERCILSDLHGLSEQQYNVLKNKGADIVSCSTISSAAVIEAKKSLTPFVIDVTKRSIFDNAFIQRPEFMVITVVRPPASVHASLIIESIEEVKPNERYYRIRKIGYYLELRHFVLPKDAKEPKSKDNFGQGLIRIVDLSFEDAQSLADLSFHRSERVDFDTGSRLLRAINEDRGQRLAYCKMGSSKLYSFFTPSNYKEHYNCLSWIRKHLEAVEINLVESKLRDFFYEDPREKIAGTKIQQLH